jgi:GNAT superfamily N-acetyltransferase
MLNFLNFKGRELEFSTFDCEYQYLEDFRLNANCREELRELLNGCFPGCFESREFFKQVPKSRILVRLNGVLIAQVAIEDRVIHLGDASCRIFGIIDLAVRQEFRNKGIATKLMEHVEELARAHQIHFLIAFADEHALYNRLGFKPVENICRWLAVDELKSIDVFEKAHPDCFLVKQISGMEWRDGVVDLLGYLF